MSTCRIQRKPLKKNCGYIYAGIVLGIVCAGGPALAEQDDASLMRDIRSRISAQPDLRELRLRFEVLGGDVEVSGKVGSPEQEASLLRVIKSTPGVRRVRDEVEVAALGGQPAPVNDTEIQAAVEQALRHSGYSPSTLDIDVAQGAVVVDGSRDSFEEIDRILSVVLNVDGVKSVQSKMSIAGKPYSSLRFKHEDGSVTQTTQ